MQQEQAGLKGELGSHSAQPLDETAAWLVLAYACHLYLRLSELGLSVSVFMIPWVVIKTFLFMKFFLLSEGKGLSEENTKQETSRPQAICLTSLGLSYLSVRQA